MKLGQLIVGALLAMSVIGCASPIVGGECKDGYVVCSGQCVRLDDNFMHCGACNNECNAVQVCRAGMCVANVTSDGGGMDGGGMDGGGTGGVGGMDDDGGVAGSGGTGGTGGITLPPDASFPGCPIGETACSGQCTHLNEDPRNCGTCGNGCSVSQFCVDGTCMDLCEDPYTFCPTPGICIDLNTNPRHCGSCGNECASGLCEDGVCQDAIPGHLIIIGHDYTASNVAMERLLRSSVFLAPGAPVPVLFYRGTASDTSFNRITQIVDAAVDRTWAPTELVNDAALSVFLDDPMARFRVFVVFPQAGESDVVLKDKLRTNWLRPLADFVRRGGVVILFEHDPADANGGMLNGGTHQILGCRDAAGDCTPLFGATGVRRVSSGSRLEVNYQDGWITNGIPAAYAAASRTMRFDGVSTPGSVVVRDEASSAPIVVHRLVAPLPQ